MKEIGLIPGIITCFDDLNRHTNKQSQVNKDKIDQYQIDFWQNVVKLSYSERQTLRKYFKDIRTTVAHPNIDLDTIGETVELAPDNIQVPYKKLIAYLKQ